MAAEPTSRQARSSTAAVRRLAARRGDTKAAAGGPAGNAAGPKWKRPARASRSPVLDALARRQSCPPQPPAAAAPAPPGRSTGSSGAADAAASTISGDRATGAVFSDPSVPPTLLAGPGRSTANWGRPDQKGGAIPAGFTAGGAAARRPGPPLPLVRGRPAVEAAARAAWSGLPGRWSAGADAPASCRGPRPTPAAGHAAALR
jgi:hypothetical protein